MLKQRYAKSHREREEIELQYGKVLQHMNSVILFKIEIGKLVYVINPRPIMKRKYVAF